MDKGKNILVIGEQVVRSSLDRGINSLRNSVLINNGNILAVGNDKELESEFGADVVYEQPHSIIMPGLVNTHTHSVQSLLKGIADDKSLLDWLKDAILPGEATFTPEEVFVSSMVGYMDLISHGTTFTNDMLTVNYSDDGIHAAEMIGIRLKVGKMLMDMGDDIPGKLIEDTDVAIEETYRLIEKWHLKTPLIEYSVNPRFLVSCSKELMIKASEIVSSDPTLSFHTHASENRDEVRLVKKLHGMDYIDALNEYGFLGSRSIIAHGIWLKEHEVSLLSQSNTAVSHNPASNCKLASGISDWINLKKEGIRVGLGTDGPPCNNTMDMFREMRLASFLQKVSKLKETVASAPEIFNMATTDGARALNHPELGIIRPGAPADIILIDIGSPFNFPIHDLISHIVYRSSGNDVIMSFINGELVYDKSEKNPFVKLPDEIISKVISVSKKYADERPWEFRDPN